MSILILVLLFTVLWKSSYNTTSFNDEYLALANCIPWRGVMALLVVFHHISQHTPSSPIMQLFYPIGCMAVSVFFFYSGYGLQTQFLSKPDYKKNFFSHRIFPILIPYLLMTFFYWISNGIIGIPMAFSTVIKNLFSEYAIVSNSWYIMCLLSFYIFYGCSMKVCKTKNGMIVATALYCMGWICFCKYNHLGNWWFNATHALLIGTIWASYYEQITSWIKKHYWILCIPLFLICIIFLIYIRNYVSNYTSAVVLSTLFPLCFLLLCMKFKINNPILSFTGKLSFELYMAHGFFLYAFRFIESDVFYTISIFIAAYLVAYIYYHIDHWIIKKISKCTRPKISN